MTKQEDLRKMITVIDKGEEDLVGVVELVNNTVLFKKYFRSTESNAGDYQERTMISKRTKDELSIETVNLETYSTETEVGHREFKAWVIKNI